MSKYKNLLTFLLVFFTIAVLNFSCQKNDLPTQINNNDSSLPSNSQSEKMFSNSTLDSQPEYVEGEIIIKFKNDATVTQKNVVFNKIKGSLKEKIHTKPMKDRGDIEGLSLSKTDLKTKDAIDLIKDESSIEYAEPNYIYYADYTINDPYYKNNYLWGMYGSSTSPANIYGIGAGTAWTSNKTGSSSIYVGIIDEGIDYSHPDLAGNIDVTHSWDFVNNDATIYHSGYDQHGTHVAGTIGAKGNSEGVAGVCWNIQIISTRFLGPNGGTTVNAVKAIDYLTNLKTNSNLNIVATNNSWGGGSYSSSLYAAIDRANTAGILFIVAAGNDKRNIDRKASYPACYPNANIISVASITSTGALSSFSNYGATTVDLGAPGSNIYSTLPNNTYGAYSGTSMATPHVTGAVALYVSIYYPTTKLTTANIGTIKAAILAKTIQTASLSGKCVSGGRLDISKF
jgi:subtilisin family serine protease